MKPTQVVAVGPSLGSFSVSAALLLALLDEFAKELEGKTAKLDSDPDFWMPLVWRNYCPIEPLLNPTAYGHGESNRLGGTKLNGYSDETVANGTNLGVRSAHEAVSTPAKFPLQECSPYSHVHARRERLGIVHRSRSHFLTPRALELRFATLSPLRARRARGVLNPTRVDTAQTLSGEAYTSVMVQKGVPLGVAAKHYGRMQVNALPSRSPHTDRQAARQSVCNHGLIGSRETDSVSRLSRCRGSRRASWPCTPARACLGRWTWGRWTRATGESG